jgi:hypothetical protein
MQWLVIGSLLITAACDLASLFMVLLAHKPTIEIWRWRCVPGLLLILSVCWDPEQCAE